MNKIIDIIDFVAGLFFLIATIAFFISGEIIEGLLACLVFGVWQIGDALSDIKDKMK
jgi:hypothetical protein